MNRIYQGRVTKIERLDSKGNAVETLNPETLWQHHELFQDAVNYYTLALAAMAEGCADTAFHETWVATSIKQAEVNSRAQETRSAKLVTEAKERATAQLKALTAWRGQVADSWKRANRKAVTFNGPCDRLAGILELDPASAGFKDAASRILQASQATRPQLSLALLRLMELADKSDLSTMAVSKLPFLCSRTISAGDDQTANTQLTERQNEVRRIQEAEPHALVEVARALNLNCFFRSPPKGQYTGEAAAQRLRDCFSHITKDKGNKAARFLELKKLAARLETEIKRRLAETPESVVMPQANKPPAEFHPTAIFKFLPTSETWEACKTATASVLKREVSAEMPADPLDAARIGGLPVFEYFTNRSLVRTKDEGKLRAAWFDFDLAAFVEAIKAPHRYFEDTIKREEAANRLRSQIAAMEGKGRESSGADDEDESLSGFDGDARIELLKDVVHNKLAWLAESEGEGNPSSPKEYSIRERTVRGFGEIRRRWRSAAEAGQVTEKRLLDILADEQAAHRDDFGSATLYRELAKPDYHPIWRDSGTQPWHAEDPLAAWLDYKNLQSDLADKERPIRFTPAHPKHSPRFFIFPKTSEKNRKSGKASHGKIGLLSRHEPRQLSFTAGIVLRTEQGRVPTVVRIHYAAPRICRDKLRSSGDANLYEVPWLQPMMAALGLENSPDRVNFANCRITLQPASGTDIQLSFPIEVNTEKIRAAVAREDVWEKQFNLHPDGDKFYNASLRWLHEKQPTKPRVPWHEQVDVFRCVATDLGQRDAGAFARLIVRSNGNFGKRPSRAIGTTGRKQWRAALERSGLFRLPGEDARVWREKSNIDERDPEDSGKPFDFREELWGERGRPARDWETEDTAELMRLLEVPPENKELSLLPADWRGALSFPEQNDKLLVAMRRYQSRIARLHRWCWFLKSDEKQQESGWREIGECEDTRLVLPDWKVLAEKHDLRVGRELESQLRERLTLAPVLLVRIANRILPLRGRSWRWEKHPAATEDNTLHHLTQEGSSLDSKENPVWLRGQRGLSMERIEQVEELRKRFQSLNQLLRREVGGKPPIRRDESVPDPCPDLLDKLDNLKVQRVNQTAHMVLAEALGLRLAPPPADKKTLNQQQDQHGVYQKTLDKNNQWIGPADFIVIEDLSRYRANQGRAPRENSRLMKWCHRAVRDKLKQLCEVFGLPVLETPAAYSSRFCSRSGVPGFRAEEVTAGFTQKGHWAWLAGKKDEQGNPKEEAQRLLAIDQELTEAQAELERDCEEKHRPQPFPRRTLLVPMSGGPMFVPVVDKAEGTDLNPAIVQADINAAINLALRAIADPRLWAIHPRLRSKREGGGGPTRDGKRKAKRGAAPSSEEARWLTREKRKFGEAGKPLVIHRSATAKADDTRQPNFFADSAGLKTLADQLGTTNREHTWLAREWTSAEIVGESGVPQLIHGKCFWGCVKAAQWERCMRINDARLAAWSTKLNPLP